MNIGELNWKSQIVSQFNLLNNILDLRFGEIDLYQNKFNKSEFIMAKSRVLEDQSLALDKVQRLKEKLTKGHANFLGLLDYESSVFRDKHLEKYQIT